MMIIICLIVCFMIYIIVYKNWLIKPIKKLDLNVVTNKYSLDCKKFPLNIIINNAVLLCQFRENLNNKFNAYLNVTDNDCFIVRRKNRLSPNSSQLDDYETWLNNIKLYVDTYEKDKFETFTYKRCEKNDKYWNDLISKLTLVMIQPNKHKNLVIYNQTDKEIIIEGFKNEIEKIKTFIDEQSSLLQNTILPISNSNYSVNKLPLPVPKFLPFQNFSIQEKFYYVNTSIADFILTSQAYFDSFLKSNNLNSVTISECIDEIDKSKIQNYADKINNNLDGSMSKLLSIKAKENESIVKTYELIQNRFRIYLYNLNEKCLDLVMKGRKFSTFLNDLKQGNNNHFDEMIKVDLSKNLIRIIGDKSSVDTLKDKLVDFFDSNIIFTTYLNEFSGEDLKYFQICFGKDLQKFSDEKSKILDIKNLIEFENIPKNTLEIDNYKIKLTSNSQYLLEFRNLLKTKLKDKICSEFELSNIELDDFVKENKYLNQLDSIEKSNNCVILPIKNQIADFAPQNQSNKIVNNTTTINKSKQFNFEEGDYVNKKCDFVAYFYDHQIDAKIKFVVHSTYKMNAILLPFDAVLISMNDSFMPNSFSDLIIKRAGEEVLNEFNNLVHAQLEDFFDRGGNLFELFQESIFETSSGNLTNLGAIFYAIVPEKCIDLDMKSFLSTVFFNFFIKCFENKIKRVAISLEFMVDSKILDINTVCEIFLNVVESQIYKGCCLEEIHVVSSHIGVSMYLMNKSEDVNSKIITEKNQKCSKISVPNYVASQTKKNNVDIKIIYGSIVDPDLKVDAIVNSTTPSLELSNGQVSAIIHKMAGDQIQAELKSNYPNGLTKTEPVAVSSAGNLINLKLIFHCSIAKWNDSEMDALRASLETKIHRLLSTAENYYLDSIAFPAFGTGTLEYPPDIICEWMFDSVNSYYLNKKNDSTLKSILFVIYKEDHKTVNAFKNYEMYGHTDYNVTNSNSDNEIDEIEVSFYENLSISNKKCSVDCDDVKITVYNGDIFDTTNDVLVNPTNSQMSQDGLISRLLCQRLSEEYKNNLETAKQFFTGLLVTDVNELLNCKSILHLDVSSNDIEKCIFDGLKLLNELGYNSVVFPPISNCSLRRNPNKICNDMLNGINSFLKYVKEENGLVNIRKIDICIFFRQGFLLETFKEEIQVFSTIQTKYSFPKSSSFPSLQLQKDTTSAAADHSILLPKKMKLKLISNVVDNINRTKSDINDFIMKEFKTHEVKNEYFNSNIEISLKNTIEKLCQDHQVKFNWDLKANKIILNGQNDKVFDTSTKIYEIITNHLSDEKNKKEAEIVALKIQWEYCVNDKWIPHNIYTNNQIEKNYESKINGKFEFIGDQNIVYIAEPKNMIQYRKDNVNYRLKLRRLNINDMKISIKMPDIWLPNKDQDLINLHPSDKEFLEIKSYFNNNGLNETAQNLKKIVSIHRIQNKRLYIQYVTHKEEFVKKYGNNTNELRLFHGTAFSSVENIWKSGFNRSYAGKNATRFGEGVYFAKNASYSHKYTDIRFNTGNPPTFQGHIFVSKVLIGNTALGTETTKIPPLNTDTTVDNTQKPSIFVIYHDAQAYPEYLLTYE